MTTHAFAPTARASLTVAMRLVLLFLAAAACASPAVTGADGGGDASAHNFKCAGTWVCSNDDGGTMVLTLTSQSGRCVLAGLSPETVLAPDGALTQAATTVGHVTGSGDSVQGKIGAATFVCRGATESTATCSPSCGAM